jgi:hypothetical protein
MNKFIISFLHGITFLVFVFASVSFSLQLIVTIFDLPNEYITDKSKNGTSWITIAPKGNIIPVNINMNILNDTIVKYKKKDSFSKLRIGNGDFPLHEKGLVRHDEIYDTLKSDILEHISEVELDTVVGSFEPYLARHHPFRKGLKKDSVFVRGLFSDKKSLQIEDIIPRDSLKKNPFFQVESINSVKGFIEVNASTKRDRIFLSLPEWIDKILVILLIYQFLRILKNVKRNIIFDKINIKRIQFIGLLMIGFFLESVFANFLYHTFLVSNFFYRVEYIPYGFLDYQGVRSLSLNVMKEFKPTNLYVGLITLTLSTIFKRGLALQQEQDLTV